MEPVRGNAAHRAAASASCAGRGPSIWRPRGSRGGSPRRRERAERAQPLRFRRLREPGIPDEAERAERPRPRRHWRPRPGRPRAPRGRARPGAEGPSHPDHVVVGWGERTRMRFGNTPAEEARSGRTGASPGLVRPGPGRPASRDRVLQLVEPRQVHLVGRALGPQQVLEAGLVVVVVRQLEDRLLPQLESQMMARRIIPGPIRAPGRPAPRGARESGSGSAHRRPRGR